MSRLGRPPIIMTGDNRSSRRLDGGYALQERRSRGPRFPDGDEAKARNVAVDSDGVPDDRVRLESNTLTAFGTDSRALVIVPP
jgi:hypothetical protein